MKKKGTGRKGSAGGSHPGKNSFFDELRQVGYPSEWKIQLPVVPVRFIPSPQETPPPHPRPTTPKHTETERELRHMVNDLMKTLLETANCIWYLKTKFHKRDWNDAGVTDEDPRVRRALSKINHARQALEQIKVEIQDPTNQRYHPGMEHSMTPVQFIPKEGITYEFVESTVTPIVYFNDKIIQRGEVFIAVPPPEPGKEGAELAPSEPRPEP